MKGLLLILLFLGMLAFNWQMRRERPTSVAARPSAVPSTPELSPPSTLPLASPTAQSSPLPGPRSPVSATVPVAAAWMWKRQKAISNPIQISQEQLVRNYKVLVKLRKQTQLYREFQNQRIELFTQLIALKKRQFAVEASYGDPEEMRYNNLRTALGGTAEALRGCEAD